MDTLVIVGAGHCGGRTALALREAGWAGPVVLVGDEAEPPYERPPLSKGVLCGEAFSAALAPASRYAEAGITWLGQRRATAIDRPAQAVVLDDGQRIGYHRLLLATGGRARGLTIPGAGLPGVLTLRTRADAEALAPRLQPGARVVVVGGGFIGLEVAASARAQGCAVTLLEAAPRLLGRGVPESIAARVQALHQAQGVVVRTGTAPVGIVPAGRALRLHLADGSLLDADTLVVGIGIVPNTELAAQAGLACANGIVVDAQLRTTDPAILAAGDVAAFPSALAGRTVRRESWHNAEDHARVAATNLATHLTGRQATVGETPWFWSDQYDHQLQVAGEPTLGTTTATRPLADGAVIEAHFDAQRRLAGLVGFGPTGALAKEFKLARVLFERGVHPAPAAFADPGVKLRSLL